MSDRVAGPFRSRPIIRAVRSVKLAAVVFFTAFATAVVAGAMPMTVATHTLANGLKILVHEDHDIPNVALYLHFRVGSRNEKPGITGLSHFIEHMMFNGSKQYGPQQFDIVMETNGGSNNAYTTRDVTVYSDWFASSALDLVLSMEAERLANLSFDPAMVESERNVVLSERRSTVENDNFGFLFERVYATLYREHPYRWPVLGWISDIRSWNLSELREYFDRTYGPENCVMVAVGDVTAPAFVTLAEKYFGPLKRRGPSLNAHFLEPDQKQERRVEIKRQAQAPAQLIAYRVPGSSHKDHWALEVANAVLSSGRSSRLYRRLVRDHQLASSVTSWQRFTLDPGELLFSIDVRSDADVAALDRFFDEELELLQTRPPSKRELRAAKNGLLTELARSLRTNSGKADQLGTYEIFFGDYRVLLSAPDRIEQVTAADVQRVAKDYFRPSNRAMVTLSPEGFRHQGETE